MLKILVLVMIMVPSRAESDDPSLETDLTWELSPFYRPEVREPKEVEDELEAVHVDPDQNGYDLEELVEITNDNKSSERR
jgi:hypothetical protein